LEPIMATVTMCAPRQVLFTTMLKHATLETSENHIAEGALPKAVNQLPAELGTVRVPKQRKVACGIPPSDITTEDCP
jgi:hypothetical protein